MPHDFGPGTVHVKELIVAVIDSPAPSSRPSEIERPFEAEIFYHSDNAIHTETGRLALTSEMNDLSRVAIFLGRRELYGVEYPSREEAWTIFGDDACAENLIKTAIFRSAKIE